MKSTKENMTTKKKLTAEQIRKATEKPTTREGENLETPQPVKHRGKVVLTRSELRARLESEGD